MLGDGEWDPEFIDYLSTPSGEMHVLKEKVPQDISQRVFECIEGCSIPQGEYFMLRTNCDIIDLPDERLLASSSDGEIAYTVFVKHKDMCYHCSV